MTFSCDLWNGFDFVYSHFNERRQGLKQLLYIFSEKYDYENECAKGIKRLYDYNYTITNEGTLATGLSVFRNELLLEYNHKVEYLNNLKEGLIEPLRNFLEAQITNGRKYHVEIKELEREFKSVCDYLDKSKLRYHSCARVAEEAKLQSEMARNNQNLSNDKKNKHFNKVQQCLKEAKEAEKVYIDNINVSNMNRERYTEVAKKILDEFQIMEEKYIECSREFLRKFFEFQFIYIKNLSAGYEKKIKTIEIINTTADIKEFIEKNATNLLPPYKFEFIPYTSDAQTKYYEQTSYPIEVINKVKSFISKAFVSELPETEPDQQQSKHNNEIQGIINSAWEGRITEEDKKNFIKYAKDKRCRKYFLTCLNKFRINGMFTLDEKSFTFLGELLLRVLDETLKEKDFESAKFCMILSQTFYKVHSDPNKPRIFLQEAIETHEIWKQIEFWEGIIKYSINEEIHNHRSFHNYHNESQSEKQMRIQSIGFGQLLSFSFNMLSFEIGKEKVRDVIKNFSKIYKIPEELSSQIVKSVDEYSATIDQQVKMEIVDDNLSAISEEIAGDNIAYDDKILKNIMESQNQISNVNLVNTSANLEVDENQPANLSNLNKMNSGNQVNFSNQNSGNIYNNTNNNI